LKSKIYKLVHTWESILGEWPEFPVDLKTLLKEQGCNVERAASIPTPDVVLNVWTGLTTLNTN